jgi:DNA invertase Pin-like site-specific DNA recombinase
MMALAQWERKLIGDRTKAGLKAIQARGTKLGRRPNVSDETMRTIRALRGSGLSWQKVADALTREGIPTAQGGRWHGATVRKIAEGKR